MKSNHFSNARLIFRIWKEAYEENPVVTYYEAFHGITEKAKTILEIVLPAAIINAVTGGSSLKNILIICVIYGAANTVLGLCERSLKLLQEAQGFKSVNLFFSKINRKAMAVDYKDTESPESLDKLQTAKDAVWEFIDVGYVIFNDILGSLISFAAMSYLFCSLSPWLYPLVLGLTVLSTVIERKKEAVNHKFYKEESHIRRRVSYCSGLLQNQKLGKEVRAFNASKYLLEKHRAEQQKQLTIVEQKQHALMRLSLIQKTLKFLQLVFIYLIAIMEYTRGNLAIGSFLLYVGASQELFTVVAELFDNYAELSAVTEYYRDYREYMEIEETMSISVEKNMPESGQDYVIEFRNVSFHYPNQEKMVLNNINLTLRKGERIALLGENGSGKSTLVKLLLRLYDPTEGEILLNGISIKEYDYQDYKRFFSCVFQDYQMFAYTIRENICFDDLDEEKLNRAAAEAELDSVLAKSPQGLDTYMGKEFSDESVDYSGGEKQKIALARGFYRDGKIAVFDESTAALDPINESRLYEKINRFCADKTAVFISHRMGSTQFCNKIYVLDDGRIVEEGTHEQLMKHGGNYCDMYEKQAKYYV